MYADLSDALKAWGINSVVIETLEETKRGSKQCNTDWWVCEFLPGFSAVAPQVSTVSFKVLGSLLQLMVPEAKAVRDQP